ncbi:MAG TPA: hypothetical protein PLB81_13870 [Deltaproteobacteria bacterium]|nr:hypothetical protein [Deltaproteobacteria bacterium]
MKKGTAFIGAFLVMIICSSPIAAAEKGKVGPWVKINEKDGIVAYARDNSRVPLKEGRCVGVINSSAENIENMMRDWDAYLKVLFMAKEAHPATGPFCKPGPDTYCAYLRQGAPWPVEDRDGYGTLNFYVDKPTGEVLVKVTVGENTMPLTKNVTRLPFCEMEWMIRPIDANHCLVVYQLMMVPGGSIDKLPKSVINWSMKHFGILTFENIRKLAKQDKYKHAKGYITKTDWPADLRYYIEDINTSDYKIQK